MAEGTTNVLTKLKKTQFMAFIDIAEDATFEACQWKRIRKSTQMNIAMNAQTETNEWIESEIGEEEVTSNQPELGQENALYEGDPIYDFLFNKFYNMPTGEECKVPFLQCFAGKDKKAWRSIATIILDSLDAVAGKLTYSIKLGGNVEKGTYTITEGTPTFTTAQG